jgi:hypothetical protein
MKKYLGWLKVLLKPKGRRICLECGFLALDDSELSYTDRVLLETHLGGHSMGLPNWQKIWCVKHLRVLYETGYVGPTFEGLEAELSQSRRRCPGWYKHKPGYSPQKHFTFQEQAWPMRANRMTVAIGASVGGLVGALVSWLLYFFTNV